MIHEASNLISIKFSRDDYYVTKQEEHHDSDTDSVHQKSIELEPSQSIGNECLVIFIFHPSTGFHVFMCCM